MQELYPSLTASACAHGRPVLALASHSACVLPSLAHAPTRTQIVVTSASHFAGASLGLSQETTSPRRTSATPNTTTNLPNMSPPVDKSGNTSGMVQARRLAANMPVCAVCCAVYLRCLRAIAARIDCAG